jgi:hypothetical protein
VRCKLDREPDVSNGESLERKSRPLISLIDGTSKSASSASVRRSLSPIDCINVCDHMRPRLPSLDWFTQGYTSYASPAVCLRHLANDHTDGLIILWRQSSRILSIFSSLTIKVAVLTCKTFWKHRRQLNVLLESVNQCNLTSHRYL